MSAEHLDVLIVGAGIAGITTAYRLQTRCPDKSYAIVERRAELGGTWDLFRYPGIRSDSSMSTLGFPFRPWTDPRSIAGGGRIAQYIGDTARQFAIDDKIRYRHAVTAASWSSQTALWTVQIRAEEVDEPVVLTCKFLYMCSGYYDYDRGYRPDFPGYDTFTGDVIHPQHWPENYDYSGKRVVVIGSGATALTLVPAMAETAKHVTMLQRSPTYIMSLPGTDPLVGQLHRQLPEPIAASLLKWKGLLLGEASYRFCRAFPHRAARVLRNGIARALNDPAEVAENFTPDYKPWDQRLCLVPDADLFTALNAGAASVVTATINTFTERGITLVSGEVLDADVIVTATGLTMQPCGGVRIDVDGGEVNLGSAFLYRGVLLSGVPNFGLCLGYSNASWTLRADISARYLCRLLSYMDRKGYRQAVPRYRGTVERARPALDLASGYVARGAAAFPKQGQRAPWRRTHYIRDSIEGRFGSITRSMDFSASPAGPVVVPTATELKKSPA